MRGLAVWVPAAIAVGIHSLWFWVCYLPHWKRYYCLWGKELGGGDRRAVTIWLWIWLLEFIAGWLLAAASIILSAGGSGPGGLGGLARSTWFGAMLILSLIGGLVYSWTMTLLSLGYSLLALRGIRE